MHSMIRVRHGILEQVVNWMWLATKYRKICKGLGLQLGTTQTLVRLGGFGILSRSQYTTVAEQSDGSRTSLEGVRVHLQRNLLEFKKLERKTRSYHHCKPSYTILVLECRTRLHATSSEQPSDPRELGCRSVVRRT